MSHGREGYNEYPIESLTGKQSSDLKLLTSKARFDDAGDVLADGRKCRGDYNWDRS